MDGRTQLKKTAPGATLEGKLARSVYWRDTEVFPKGSQVRLVVDKIESQKKSLCRGRPALCDSPFCAPARLGGAIPVGERATAGRRAGSVAGDVHRLDATR